MKRLFSFILSLILLTGTLTGLSGCSNQDHSAVVTRAEWISMIAGQQNLTESQSQEAIFSDVKSSNPYFQEIQACAEWNIIDKSGEFKPDDNATIEFAEVTAIKAIGTARLEKSDYKATLQTDADIVAFFKTQSGLDLSGKKVLTKNQAEEILAKAHSISEEMTLPQVYEIDYKDNVKEMTMDQVLFRADGQTATLRNTTANVGDVIVVKPTPYMPEGKYVRITANNNGVLSYEDANIDEICNDYEVSGTFDTKVLAVRPLSDGITINSIGDSPVVENQSYNGTPNISYVPLVATNNQPNVAPLADTYNNAGSIVLSVNKSFGAVSVSGSVKINFDKITIDYGKWVDDHWFNGKDDTRNSFVRIDDTVSANISVSGKLSKTIPLAEVGVSAYEAIGLYANLSLNIGIDGSVSVDVSLKTWEEVTIAPWQIAKAKMTIGKTDPTVSYNVNVHAYVKPNLEASVKIFRHKVAWIGVDTGLEAQAIMEGTVTTDSALNCIDLKMWVPLKVYWGFDVIVASKSDQKVIWNSSSSPFNPQLHIENGQKVDSCTRGNNAGDTDEVFGDEPDPITNYDLLRDYFSISAYYVALTRNANDKIIVSHIPEGYSANDLVFESDKPQVVSVDASGNLTAAGAGTATIKISTRDGEYAQFCAVSVIDDGGSFYYDPLL